MNGMLGGGLNEMLAGLMEEIPDGAIYRENDMIQGGENYEIHGGAMDYFLGGNEDEIPETEQDIVSTVYPPIFINVQGNDYEISLGQNIMEPRDDDGYEISTVLPPLDLTGKNKGEDYLREEPPTQPYGNIFAHNEIISTVYPPLVIKPEKSAKQSKISDVEQEGVTENMDVQKMPEIKEEKDPENEVYPPVVIKPDKSDKQSTISDFEQEDVTENMDVQKVPEIQEEKEPGNEVYPQIVIKADKSDKQSTISDHEQEDVTENVDVQKKPEIQEEKEPDNEVPEEKQNIVTRLPWTEIKHSRKQNPTKKTIGEEQMKNTHDNKEEIKTKKKGKLFNFLYGDTNQMQINANKIKLDTDGNIIDGEFNPLSSMKMLTMNFV